MSISGTLLFVHGRDYKPDRDVWMDLSHAALRAGLERDFPDCLETFATLQADVAWYGDLNRSVLDAHGKNYDEALDISDRKTTLAALQTISERKKFGIRNYDCMPGKSALPEFAASMLAPFFAATGLSRFALRYLAHDVSCYLNPKNDYGDAARAIVRAKLMALLDSDGPVIVVSHGSGSLIVYDVLWELSHDPAYAALYADKKVDTLITLGSPLGDSGLQKLLKGAKQPPKRRFPTNIINWHNVAAEDDYWCHDNTLANDYRWLVRQKKISLIRDYKVFNCAVRYGRSSPHSSIGYFIHPRVAKIIADWLQHNAPQVAT